MTTMEKSSEIGVNVRPVLAAVRCKIGQAKVKGETGEWAKWKRRRDVKRLKGWMMEESECLAVDERTMTAMMMMMIMMNEDAHW